MAARTLTLVDARTGQEHTIEVDGDRVSVDGKAYRAVHGHDGSLRIDGDRSAVAWTALARNVRWVFVGGRVFELSEENTKVKRRGGAHQGALTAPMPATVRRVVVQVGDRVKRGDSLVILEAMKMELPIRAPSNGTVRSIACQQGELVQPGVPLLELNEEE